MPLLAVHLPSFQFFARCDSGSALLFYLYSFVSMEDSSVVSNSRVVMELRKGSRIFDASKKTCNAVSVTQRARTTRSITQCARTAD